MENVHHFHAGPPYASNPFSRTPLGLQPARCLKNSRLPGSCVIFSPKNTTNSTMRSLWIFILGTVINLGFIFVIAASYWKSMYSDEPGMTKPGFPVSALVVAAFVLAGILARYFDRPGLGNILVLVFPVLALLTVGLFVLIFILPKGIGPAQLFGILLAILAIAGGVYLKAGSYRRIFDASRMQAARQQEIQSAAAQTVQFSNTGRSGQVTYNGAEGRFSLYFEFGGNDVVAIINVPGREQWLERTGIALEHRERILNHIGQVAVNTQTKKGWYTFQGDAIVVYSG